MRFIVKAVTDDRDFCQCCGKTGLKRVVWIEDTETNEVRHFGTTCAASPVKGFGVDREIRQAIDSFKRSQQVIWAIAHRKYRAMGGQYTGDALNGFKATDMALFNDCCAEARA